MIFRGRAFGAVTWADGGAHSNELQKHLRGDGETRIAVEKRFELLFFFPGHELEVLVAREGAENVDESIAGDDWLVLFVNGYLGVVLEYIV